MKEALWIPSPNPEHPLLTLQRETGSKNYWELHKWSIENPSEFWSRVWDDLEIIGDKGSTPYKAGEDFISTEFFPEARLNIVESILSKGRDGEVAITGLTELDLPVAVTWRELRQRVAATAAAMRNLGVSKGDRVVAWAPNVPEVVIWALGALSIGAVVSTASPDFSSAAVADRFGQVEPKLLLVSESYTYAGKRFDLREKILEINSLLPTLVSTVRINQFQDFIEPYLGANMIFERVPFNHPGFILFSSGTTGKPKCIVHSAAGVYLKVGEELHYQFSITPGEKVLFFTTCGWMMWNWLVLVLGRGASIVLYDGSPGFERADYLFYLAAREKLDFLGLSAKYIDSLRKAEITSSENLDLAQLRMIGSTGSVLSPESFEYVYKSIKADVHLASLSGGTDICGCFLTPVPILPVFRGELQGPALGMAVEVLNDSGSIASYNEKGELVCLKPFPSQPLGFWGDIDNEKYRSAYFEGFPGVWTHGDFASRSETGGFTIFGRSDATLNSKGVRIGTAEIYRVVEKFEEIREAMAVAQDWEDDSRVILFVVMQPSESLTEELISSMKKALRNEASPRHVPEKIIAAPELPRTKSNKLVELAVADAINGRQIRNRDALANPQALDWFIQLTELKQS
jgi:acetoacetyl-CoA synthetase